jgi:hypothetical protein
MIEAPHRSGYLPCNPAPHARRSAGHRKDAAGHRRGRAACHVLWARRVFRRPQHGQAGRRSDCCHRPPPGRDVSIQPANIARRNAEALAAGSSRASRARQLRGSPASRRARRGLARKLQGASACLRRVVRPCRRPASISTRLRLWQRLAWLNFRASRAGCRSKGHGSGRVKTTTARVDP